MAALPAPTVVELDVPVATYALGPEDGRVPGGQAEVDVVLCHGTPWSARVWAPVAHLLARRRRVHLWDMPGYGASIPHTSRGAPAAVDLVAQRRRLVADHEDVFAALPAPLHRALVREYVAGAGGPGLAPGLPGELADPWEGAEGQAAFYRQVAALRPEYTRPIVERLGDVRAPVAIGWGEVDPWIPVEQASELARRLPGDPVVTVLPGVGHLAPLEAPGAVADLISGHLASP